MPATAIATPRFLRKTTLAENEYRKNFRQIDNDVIDLITSPEADAVTPLMSKIYLKLLKAPDRHVESTGVLRFEEEIREGKRHTAWQVLCQLLGVSSSTANKAIKWLHQQGVIGYFSAKNGVGLRIFLNRASSSIGIRPPTTNKKILPFSPASTGESRASSNGAGFSRSFHDQENLDPDIISRSPNGGADQPLLNKTNIQPLTAGELAHASRTGDVDQFTGQGISRQQIVGDIVALLKVELEPSLQIAAARATSHEQERTREWFINHALPKAIRVAQASAYDVLRTHGHINEPRSRNRTNRNGPDDRKVGARLPAEVKPRLLSDHEITELAQGCVALLVTQGQTIARTLSEMSVEAGGFLMPEDAPKVRARAEVLTRAGATAQSDGREGNGS